MVFLWFSHGFQCQTHDPQVVPSRPKSSQVVLEVQGRPRGRSGQGALVQLRSGSVLGTEDGPSQNTGEI